MPVRLKINKAHRLYDPSVYCSSNPTDNCNRSQLKSPPKSPAPLPLLSPVLSTPHRTAVNMKKSESR